MDHEKQRTDMQKKEATRLFFNRFLLPDQDSNLDKQNQNLWYYHYTIGQFRMAKLSTFNKLS